MLDKGILPFRRELKSEDRAEGEGSAAAPAPNSWLQAFAADAEMPHAYLLLVRFALVNLAGFAFLAAAWFQGWVLIAHRADGTYQSHGIFALFLVRSEEHTSELQSLRHLVCRLLLEKKKN